jgi:hypothetical protein
MWTRFFLLAKMWHINDNDWSLYENSVSVWCFVDYGLGFYLISSDRTNANAEPGLTLLYGDEISGTVFHISKMERTSNIWIELLNGTLVAKACLRLWIICCYSAVLDLGLWISFSCHQNFIEADSNSWTPHTDRCIWGMTEACFNCPWKSSAGKLMCSFISPDPNYLKSTRVPIYSHFYQYWYCCANRLIILVIDNSVQLINTTKIKNKTYSLSVPFYIVLFSVLTRHMIHWKTGPSSCKFPCILCAISLLFALFP